MDLRLTYSHPQILKLSKTTIYSFISGVYFGKNEWGEIFNFEELNFLYGNEKNILTSYSHCTMCLGVYPGISYEFMSYFIDSSLLLYPRFEHNNSS